MSSTVLARLVVLVVAAALSASCTQVVTGTPSGDPEVLAGIAERAEPLTARAALGDFRTIDYCSLLDGVRTSVRGELSPPPDASFEYCGYYFETGDSPLYVLVGYLDNRRTARSEPGEPVTDYRQLPHDLGVSRLTLDGELCGYTLNFPGGQRLRVLGNSRDGSQARNCELARNALDKMIAVVTSGAVRHYTFPRNSFGTRNACGKKAALLNTAQVTDVLGEGVRRIRWPSGHACNWNSPSRAATDVFAAMYFYTAKPGKVAAAGERTNVSGRASIVDTIDGSACRVLTTGISTDYMVEGASGGGLVEVAAVEVDVANAEKSCDAARALAEEAWPSLPESV